MNAVHDTLPTNVGDVQMNNFCQLCGHYIYQAARSDVVGQCRQSIEALLPLFYGKAAPSDRIQLGL